MTTSKSTLTPKQQRYLSLLQLAETEQVSVIEVAKQNAIDPSLLYAARKTLRQKGFLPQATSSSEKFQTVPISTAASNNIELKTQLANGQPVWLSVPAAHVGSVLKALSL